MTNNQLQAHLKSGANLDFGLAKCRSPSPHIKCADGFTFSVQASDTHYCMPRDLDGPYTHVEVGYPSEVEESLMPYAEDEEKPTDTVYARVPVGIVLQIIMKHGGAV